jgi:hypothetical protein
MPVVLTKKCPFAIVDAQTTNLDITIDRRDSQCGRSSRSGATLV